MSLPQKIWFAFRSLFYPGAAAYNERRASRILVLSVLIGIVIAVGFGFALYYLNQNQTTH